MRKSFDGLCGLVSEHLKGDPLSGAIYLFVNRRGDRIKALYWDGDGFALWYKRLESGTFVLTELPKQGSDRIDAWLPDQWLQANPQARIVDHGKKQPKKRKRKK
jgi:transposase